MTALARLLAAVPDTYPDQCSECAMRFDRALGSDDARCPRCATDALAGALGDADYMSGKLEAMRDELRDAEAKAERCDAAEMQRDEMALIVADLTTLLRDVDRALAGPVDGWRGTIESAEVKERLREAVHAADLRDRARTADDRRSISVAKRRRNR